MLPSVSVPRMRPSSVDVGIDDEEEEEEDGVVAVAMVVDTRWSVADTSA